MPRGSLQLPLGSFERPRSQEQESQRSEKSTSPCSKTLPKSIATCRKPCQNMKNSCQNMTKSCQNMTNTCQSMTNPCQNMTSPCSIATAPLNKEAFQPSLSPKPQPATLEAGTQTEWQPKHGGQTRLLRDPFLLSSGFLHQASGVLRGILGCLLSGRGPSRNLSPCPRSLWGGVWKNSPFPGPWTFHSKPTRRAEHPST